MKKIIISALAALALSACAPSDKAEQGFLMHFNSQNIFDEFYYGPFEGHSDENVFYIVYDDPDAGCEYEVLRVAQETYYAIQEARWDGYEIVGSLERRGSEYVLSPDSELI